MKLKIKIEEESIANKDYIEYEIYDSIEGFEIKFNGVGKENFLESNRLKKTILIEIYNKIFNKK